MLRHSVVLHRTLCNIVKIMPNGTCAACLIVIVGAKLMYDLTNLQHYNIVYVKIFFVKLFLQLEISYLHWFTILVYKRGGRACMG